MHRISLCRFRLNVQDKSLADPAGQPVQISHRALDTLAVLVRNRGNTLSKATLIETVWPDVYVEANNLNQAITGIREALGDNKEASRFIKTFKGKGYCFVADVKQVSGTNLPTDESHVYLDLQKNGRLIPAIFVVGQRHQKL